MPKLKHPLLALSLSLALTACATHTTALQSSAHALNIGTINSLEFSGTGLWYQFGQAPNPSSAWPPFAVSRYTADVNYLTGAERVQITRRQVVEPGRLRPDPVEQKVDQYVKGATAWNVARAANAPATATPTPSAQAATVEERKAEILATPHGFLRAALANNASLTATGTGTEVSFTTEGKYRYVGQINDKGEVTRVQTWIDSPVLGDTLVQTDYSDYKDFSGVAFPGHIVRTQGGYPVLDINVNAVTANPAVDIVVPSEVANAQTAVKVKAEKLAEGVYYLTGGTHHSVAIEQNDHVVLVEAPLNEDRSQALIAKTNEIIPNKPIKYLVNTHAHFDHSGGLRTFVDAGATIVTEQANQAYYEKIWANPHTLKPDRLAKSGKAASFATFSDKQVLSDGKRTIELYPIAGNGHNDAFALVFLPAEKILIEADAYTPPAANTPPPSKPNPYSVNLYDNVQNLHLDVKQIAALHGPHVVGLAELRTAIAVR